MSARIELGELHRFTTDEYHRLGEAGAFEDHPPVELLEGLLVRKGMKSREHEQAIVWLNRHFMFDVLEARTGDRIVAPAGLPELPVDELLAAARA